MPKTGDPEAFDFSFATKRQLAAQRKELVLTDSKNLRYQFNRIRDQIDWEALRQAGTEDEVNAALSEVDQSTRDRLPNAAAIVATVCDPDYPKLRPIPFLSESCALAMRTPPKRADLYSPRYSRDICYEVRKRQEPAPKQMTNLEYWRRQAELGNKVPVRFLPRINKQQARGERRSAGHDEPPILTYNDIPGKIDGMRKRRTTVWLSETTLAQLKKLSEATGAPMAELFRRAVESYLKRS
jgi:hypothetical protein